MRFPRPRGGGARCQALTHPGCGALMAVGSPAGVQIAASRPSSTPPRIPSTIDAFIMGRSKRDKTRHRRACPGDLDGAMLIIGMAGKSPAITKRELPRLLPLLLDRTRHGARCRQHDLPLMVRCAKPLAAPWRGSNLRISQVLSAVPDHRAGTGRAIARLRPRTRRAQ